MTGMNSTEASCLFPLIAGDLIGKGCYETGWSREELEAHIKMSEKAMGGDGSKAAETVAHLEKVYGAGRDLTQSDEYSRMWLHFLGDNVHYFAFPMHFLDQIIWPPKFMSSL